MVLTNGLGRRKNTTKYHSSFEYLNKYIFPIKDLLIALKEEEYKKEKQYNAARNRKLLREQKLERAYDGLENFRNKKEAKTKWKPTEALV